VATYILNEWFWADCANENGPKNFREAVELISALASNDDSIIFVAGGRAEEKFWSLTRSNSPPAQRTLFKVFYLQIYLDSAKCRIVHTDNLPPCPRQLIYRVNVDDRYLVQAQLTVEGSIIVSTDTNLLIVLRNDGLPHESRDMFIESYLPPRIR